MTNLIAEDLVLLLLDDESGKLEHATYLDTGIGGALLVELALAETPRTAEDLVGRLGKKRRDVLLDRLRQRGILEEKEHRTLGLIPQKRWPTVDSRSATAVRRALGDALLRGVDPTSRTAATTAATSAT